jgi:hypothetical protein
MARVDTPRPKDFPHRGSAFHRVHGPTTARSSLAQRRRVWPFGWRRARSQPGQRAAMTLALHLEGIRGRATAVRQLRAHLYRPREVPGRSAGTHLAAVNSAKCEPAFLCLVRLQRPGSRRFCPRTGWNGNPGFQPPPRVENREITDLNASLGTAVCQRYADSPDVPLLRFDGQGYADSPLHRILRDAPDECRSACGSTHVLEQFGRRRHLRRYTTCQARRQLRLRAPAWRRR